MKKPISLPAIIQEHDFDSLQRQATNPREKIRLLAMSHLKTGTPYKEVAHMVRVHEKTVLSWIRRFKAEGLAGLEEQEGRGAKPRLKPEQHEAFKQAVLEYQANLAGGRIKGADARKILSECFGVELSLSRTYDLLHLVGLSWVSSRSQHPKASVERQEAFKKTL